MIDRKAITKRFFLCYRRMSSAAIARIFGVNGNTVAQWAFQGAVPWSRLKYLSDSQAISWDWLMDGLEPRKSIKTAQLPKVGKPEFATLDINRRFLSLFDNMKYYQIASHFGVTSATVSEWKLAKSQVPWEKLDYAVRTFGVRWDWLMDGVEPKFRDIGK